MTPCDFQWADGWAKDHICSKEFGHPGNHSCRCDATISDWMINNAPEVIDEETAEELEADRLRLLAEIKALQAEE